MNEKTDGNLNRREFVKRLGKATASIAAAAAVSCIAYDSKGPEAEPEKKLVTLADFSVPQEQGRIISIVTGSDRARTVNKAVKLLGGIERFVKSGETVVIKPNIAFASPAALGATANPQLVAELVSLCYKAKAKKVYVTDNPINDAASCFAISGIGKAATAAGANVILPKGQHFRNTTLAKGKLIRNWSIFYGPFEKADKVIGVAPVKDHRRSGASMSMKNFYGLLGGRRNIFHQDINTIIAELAMMVKPTLVILDGTEVMTSNGPTGGSLSDLTRKNTLIASTDMVAADSFGCSLLGLKPSDLPYLAKAEAAQAGTTDFESLKPRIAQVS